MILVFLIEYFKKRIIVIVKLHSHWRPFSCENRYFALFLSQMEKVRNQSNWEEKKQNADSRCQKSPE